jgi:NarL family two-component system response regulator LiaR
MRPTRILIADDHDIVREGLSAIISFQPEMKLVGQARDGGEVVSMARELHPDVILLDLVMPVLDGLGAIHQIKEFNPEAKILVLTSFADDALVFPAIKAGAFGYLLKDIPREQLLQAIRDVTQGRAVLDPSIAIKVIRELKWSSMPPAPADALTHRETDTLHFIARGMSNQSIAKELGVDERTVAKYVSSILAKLHLANRTQAALYAIHKGLVSKE